MEQEDQDLKQFLLLLEDHKKHSISVESEKQKLLFDLEWSHRQERLLREQVLRLQEEMKNLRSAHTETSSALSGISYLQSENLKLTIELKKAKEEREGIMAANNDALEVAHRSFYEKEEKLANAHNLAMKNQWEKLNNEKDEVMMKLQTVERRCQDLEDEKREILSENHDSYMSVKLACEEEIAKLRAELNEARAKWDAQNERFKHKWQSLQKAHFAEKQELKRQLDLMNSRATLAEVDLQAAVKRSETLESDLKKYTKYFKTKTSSAAAFYDEIVDVNQAPVDPDPLPPIRGRGATRPRSGARRGRGMIRGSTKPKLNLLDDDMESDEPRRIDPHRPYPSFEQPRRPPPRRPSYLPSYVQDEDWEDFQGIDDPKLGKPSGELKKSFGKVETKKRKLFTQACDIEEI